MIRPTGALLYNKDIPTNTPQQDKVEETNDKVEEKGGLGRKRRAPHY